MQLCDGERQGKDEEGTSTGILLPKLEPKHLSPTKILDTVRKPIAVEFS